VQTWCFWLTLTVVGVVLDHRRFDVRVVADGLVLAERVYLSADPIAEKAGAATSSTAPPFVCDWATFVCDLASDRQHHPHPLGGTSMKRPTEATVGRRAAADRTGYRPMNPPAIHAEPNRDLEPQGSAS
jgi:hypothetical protein